MGGLDTAGTQQKRTSPGVGPLSPSSRPPDHGPPITPATGRRGPAAAHRGVSGLCAAVCFDRPRGTQGHPGASSRKPRQPREATGARGGGDALRGAMVVVW